MVIIDVLSWWYLSGWGIFTKMIDTRFANLADFFSMSSLIRTLFQPFRQISAGETSVNASLEMKFQAFTDRLVSRCIGFVTRFGLLVIGIVVMIITGIVGVVMVIAWPLVPLLPVAGVLLTLSGVII